jgi:hypothetical protein
MNRERSVPMDVLIWIGAGVSVAGLAGLVWCILRILKARKAGLSDEELRAELQKVVPMNTGALLLSVLGLMIVVMGIALG